MILVEGSRGRYWTSSCCIKNSVQLVGVFFLLVQLLQGYTTLHIGYRKLSAIMIYYKEFYIRLCDAVQVLKKIYIRKKQKKYIYLLVMTSLCTWWLMISPFFGKPTRKYSATPETNVWNRVLPWYSTLDATWIKMKIVGGLVWRCIECVHPLLNMFMSFGSNPFFYISGGFLKWVYLRIMHPWFRDPQFEKRLYDPICILCIYKIYTYSKYTYNIYNVNIVYIYICIWIYGLDIHIYANLIKHICIYIYNIYIIYI